MFNIMENDCWKVCSLNNGEVLEGYKEVLEDREQRLNDGIAEIEENEIPKLEPH